MCGIVGFAGFSNAEELSNSALKVMKNRGVDSSKILEIASKPAQLIFGHNLHSVVDFVEQPLVSKSGALVINCEIYNWQELAKKHKVSAKNDAELVLALLDSSSKSEKDFKALVNELDGDFAFVYYSKRLGKLFVAKDIAGVKPLVFFHDKKSKRFAFASEKKALPFSSIHLNPRKLLVFDLKSGALKEITLKINSLKSKSPSLKHLAEIKSAFVEAVSKRIPQKKFGLLLSGGIDSTLIGKIMQSKGATFGCYFAGIDGFFEPKDLEFARVAAKEVGSRLDTAMVSLDNYEKALPEIIALIESTDPVRVGVASVIHFASRLAADNGCKVVISGLGADELFAGYSRFANSNDINKDCYSYFIKMYENDLYFEDIITMNAKAELRVPFLDRTLVEKSFALDPKYKIDPKSGLNKKVLRDIALEMGLPSEIALRPKKAAQYGSNFDKALEFLAKKNGFAGKADYLNSLAKKSDGALKQTEGLPIAALVSTGKDSIFALHLMKKQGYDIRCIITIDSKNKDSFMFHTPTVSLAKLQADALGLPLIIASTPGEKEKELVALKKAIAKAKKKYKIEGVSSGALFSNYQRERIELICEEEGIRSFAPLWHLNQAIYLRQLVDAGFVAVITRIAGAGFDESWLGRKIDSSAIADLAKLEAKYKINVAGEGGEYETLVLDAPIFSKRIVIEKSEKIVQGENTGTLIIKKASLVKK
ncbi:MAG: diphthine--ammonia ligase [archaeon]